MGVKSYRKRVTDEALLNLHRLTDDLLNPFWLQGVLQQAAQNLHNEHTQKLWHCCLSILKGRATTVTSCRDLRVQQARKVCVQALIPADELIGEGQAVHEATLLQPEDAAEAAEQQRSQHTR